MLTNSHSCQELPSSGTTSHLTCAIALISIHSEEGSLNHYNPYSLIPLSYSLIILVTNQRILTPLKHKSFHSIHHSNQLVLKGLKLIMPMNIFFNRPSFAHALHVILNRGVWSTFQIQIQIRKLCMPSLHFKNTGAKTCNGLLSCRL